MNKHYFNPWPLEPEPRSPTARPRRSSAISYLLEMQFILCAPVMVSARYDCAHLCGDDLKTCRWRGWSPSGPLLNNSQCLGAGAIVSPSYPSPQPLLTPPHHSLPCSLLSVAARIFLTDRERRDYTALWDYNMYSVGICVPCARMCYPHTYTVVLGIWLTTLR